MQMDCVGACLVKGQLLRVIRHFADNWVVAWGPGFRSDLALEWESFKAARGALGGVITAARAKDMAATFAAALPDLQAQLASFLVEGKLKVWLPWSFLLLLLNCAMWQTSYVTVHKFASLHAFLPILLYALQMPCIDSFRCIISPCRPYLLRSRKLETRGSASSTALA